MIIKAYNMNTNKTTKWFGPNKEEAIQNSEATWGRKYDRVEREVVEGGIPQLFYRMN